ncbi:EAL domain-containing protein [Crassaminicella thermophila]|uniref:EAL domain-containing protein n=1 Tax=Crassaminicella thermophila TaxID=2599308 RepID=A0A5C0SE32_CRATE|nr:EAL domain-containing protein [Crassaminicella thermophila]QEK12855.1 EAL domain-containing protein [Crassaminicella thermophila]
MERVRFYRSIKTKILAMFLIASLFIASVLILMSENISIHNLQRVIGKTEGKNVALYAEIIGAWFEERINEIQIYANSPLIKEMNWEKVKPYLEKEIENKTDIYDLFFISDKNGDTHNTLSNELFNIKDRVYFKSVMEGKTILSNPVISKSTGNETVIIAVPIKNEKGEVIGIMGADVNLIKLNSFIKNFKVDHTDSYSYLITKDGLIITHPDKERIMKDVVPAISQGINADCIKPLSKIDSMSSLFYFHEIPNTDGWKIITKVPIEYIKKPIRETSKMLFCIGIIGVILANFAGFIMARRISKPIIRLNEVFMKGAEGDLTVRAEIDSNDEIGRAAKSFNMMMKTIQYMTYYDSLTDLPNREFFRKQLKLILSHARRNKEKVAVMVFGLDRFKNINDTLGHNVGDKLLRQVGESLKKCVGEEDIISRIGGSEFTILLPEVRKGKNPAEIAQKILNCIKKSWVIDENEFYMTASIGIAYYPDDGMDELTLIKNADIAMHRAKEKGGNDYQFYTSSMDEKLIEKLSLDKDLHNAIKNEELLVYYQPKVDIYTGKIVGMEALVRWKHSQKGMISPAVFIPLAEVNGCIIHIGEWVLKTACRQNKLWQESGYEPVTVAVNISARQFQQPNFVDMVRNVLDETGLEPKYLELEITESIAVEDIEYTIGILKKLKEMNIQISLDDFGTGYSSLSYLKQFAIDNLKIDQSFIKDIIENKNDAAIASTIIAMAQNLNLNVIAEGVETKEQLEFLKKQNCDYAQGYFFSPPVTSIEFEKILKKSL